MVNTGRTICIIEDVIKELGLDGYICGCALKNLNAKFMRTLA